MLLSTVWIPKALAHLILCLASSKLQRESEQEWLPYPTLTSCHSKIKRVDENHTAGRQWGRGHKHVFFLPCLHSMLHACAVPTSENHPATTGKPPRYKARGMCWKALGPHSGRVSGRGSSLSLKHICAQRHQVEENRSWAQAGRNQGRDPGKRRMESWHHLRLYDFTCLCFIRWAIKNCCWRGRERERECS